MLRGIWGAALKENDPALYESLFEPSEQIGRVPGYLFRPALPTVLPAPAIELLFFNLSEAELSRAIANWHFALGRGIGKSRTASVTRWSIPMDESGGLSATGHAGFPLNRAHWQLPADFPCRLNFIAPLRMLRAGKVIETPTFHDIALLAARRIAAMAGEGDRLERPLQNELLALCDSIDVSPWQGTTVRFERYSASQRQELSLEGVTGYLTLTEGAGKLTELLAAALWLQLGKSTVMGLGQFIVEPLS